MHERSASNALTALCGAALAFAAGALVMYLIDPDTGRRRRARIRDRSVSMGHGTGRYLKGKGKHVTDRLKGVAAHARAGLSRHPIDDDLLRDRIRTRLGRLVDHPHDIEVGVRDGHVQLKGTVGESEFRDLLHAVSSMRGVENLESLLRVAPTTHTGAH